MSENVYEASDGVDLQFRNAGSEDAFASIGAIKDFGDLPEQMAAEFETTRINAKLDSGAIDPMKYFGLGKIDPGSFSFTLGFDEDDIDRVYGLQRVKKDFKIVFPSGSSFTFQGFIKGIKPAVKAGDEVTASCTIRITGAMTFNKAA